MKYLLLDINFLPSYLSYLYQVINIWDICVTYWLGWNEVVRVRNEVIVFEKRRVIQKLHEWWGMKSVVITLHDGQATATTKEKCLECCLIYLTK
jgi:hypothetical protein